MFIEIVHDMRHFLAVLAVVLCAFGNAFFVLYKEEFRNMAPDRKTTMSSAEISEYHLFWSAQLLQWISCRGYSMIMTAGSVVK